ncbi:HNH endonuclease [Aurantivibrio infirmus]
MNQVLQLDLSGMPRYWLSLQEAVLLYCKNRVKWQLGDSAWVMRGGVNDQGRRSAIALASVIATEGRQAKHVSDTPSLANSFLFRRDNNMCMYCGKVFARSLLTRDHIIPRVQGGKDVWTNVVTACQRCNHHKGGRTPEQAGMELLAIPFTPNIYEFMYLANRKILADQMEYLSANFSGKRQWSTV